MALLLVGMSVEHPAVFGEPEVQMMPVPEASPTPRLTLAAARSWPSKVWAASTRRPTASGPRASATGTRLGRALISVRITVPRTLVLGVIAGRGASVEIYGAGYPTPDGAVVRYYIRAEGLCRAPVLEQEEAAEKGKRRIYRLGNGNGFLVNHVIEATREVTGCKIEATEASRRAGDPDVLVGSSRKGQKSAARWPLSHGVRDAWNWGWPPRL